MNLTLSKQISHLSWSAFSFFYVYASCTPESCWLPNSMCLKSIGYPSLYTREELGTQLYTITCSPTCYSSNPMKHNTLQRTFPGYPRHRESPCSRSFKSVYIAEVDMRCRNVFCLTVVFLDHGLPSVSGLMGAHRELWMRCLGLSVVWRKIFSSPFLFCTLTFVTVL